MMEVGKTTISEAIHRIACELKYHGLDNIRIVFECDKLYVSISGWKKNGALKSVQFCISRELAEMLETTENLHLETEELYQKNLAILLEALKNKESE